MDTTEAHLSDDTVVIKTETNDRIPMSWTGIRALNKFASAKLVTSLESINENLKGDVSIVFADNGMLPNNTVFATKDGKKIYLEAVLEHRVNEYKLADVEMRTAIEEYEQCKSEDYRLNLIDTCQSLELANRKLCRTIFPSESEVRKLIAWCRMFTVPPPPSFGINTTSETDPNTQAAARSSLGQAASRLLTQLFEAIQQTYRHLAREMTYDADTYVYDGMLKYSNVSEALSRVNLAFLGIDQHGNFLPDQSCHQDFTNLRDIVLCFIAAGKIEDHVGFEDVEDIQRQPDVNAEVRDEIAAAFRNLGLNDFWTAHRKSME